MTESVVGQLAGIILTAIITTVGTWLIARYTLVGSAEKDAQARAEQREREARYLATRVVCQLDPFIYACCGVAIDTGKPGSDGCLIPEEQTPTISLPNDVDWRCLEPALMYRVLSFPNDIEAANRSITAAMEYAASPPEFSEFFTQRRKSFAQLGLSALALADDLRTKFEIPTREDRDEDPAAHLNAALSQALHDELMASPQGAILRAQIARDALKAAGVPFEE